MRKTWIPGLALVAVLTGVPARADIITEVGDAGDLPATAQRLFGDGQPVDAITGTIDRTTDVDLFLIFVSDPARFSATTSGTTGTLLDTQLFLFTADGLGVYANDDLSTVNRRSTLPAESPLGPPMPGFYYLAVSAADRDPVSGLPGSLIFPSTPVTGVFGPTGPGGAGPVSGWTGTGTGVGTYTINLTGVTLVPEPGSLLLSGIAALSLLAFSRRCRHEGRGEDQENKQACQKNGHTSRQGSGRPWP